MKLEYSKDLDEARIQQGSWEETDSMLNLGSVRRIQ